MKQDIALRIDYGRGGEQAQDGERGNALPGARFPHQRQRFPGIYVQGDIIDHGTQLALLAKCDGEGVNVKERLGHLKPPYSGQKHRAPLRQ